MRLAMERYRTFAKYCAVGVLVTAVDFTAFGLAHYGARVDVVPAKLAAFLVAVPVSLVLNRAWTFRARRSRLQRIRYRVARFVTVSGVGAGLSVGGIFLTVHGWGLRPLVGNALTSAVVVVWNLLANKLWTFRMARPACRREPPACDVSLVIPAYNEEHRLGRTLAENLAYLERQPFSWEIVVVDDGSRDGTADIVHACADAPGSRVRLLRLPVNRGKGAAVQLGVVNARGRYVLVADADNATPIEEVGPFVAGARPDEILIGSRYVASARIERRQSRGRVLVGRLGNLLIRLFVIDGIADTQCGFKLFPAEIARELFSRQRVNRWGFDIEVLGMAQGMGIPIRERGVTWRDVQGSRLRPIRDAFRTLAELLVIKINLWSGVYE